MTNVDAPIRCAANGPRATNPAVVAWLGMARLLQRTERVLTSRLQCHHLNPGQLDVLVHTAAAEGLTQQELAEQLCHSKANISQLLDKMVASGLVRRESAGRAYGIYLTNEGRSVLDEAVPEVDRLIVEQFARLSLDEQADLFRLVGKLEADEG